MNYYVLIAGAVSFFLSSAALAQHGGTDQEQRACAGRGTAVRHWTRAISPYWRISNNIGQSSPRLVEKSLRIMASNRTIAGTHALPRNDPHYCWFT
jgi:hypothetical protein